MNKYYGIIVSLIAGFSTLIGFFSIYIKGNRNKIISKTLAFSGGVMITLSLIDLIPSAILYLNTNYNLFISIIYSIFFLLCGILISFILDKLVDNKGLYKTGIISMIGIILHNIPEGIATYILSTMNLKLGIILSIGIILHNIPEGISISIPIYHSTNNRLKAFFYTFISGISEPIGGVLAMGFLYKYIDNNLIGILFSIISGLMLYIGYYEMIKTSRKYSNYTLFYSMIGSIFILIVEILLKM